MSTGKSDPAIMIDGVAVAVRVCRSARARSYRLSIDGVRNEVRLSLPVRANLRRALGWAQDHAPWVKAQMASTPAPVPIANDAVLPVEGRPMRICWLARAGRTIRMEDDRLVVGGAAESVGPRVLRWLKARALAVLEAETRALAADHGLHVASVGIGDPRSRWGSCASSGAIRYSWRLILCPPEVRRATVAHELAHLLYMDHSAAFHAAHARILGQDPKPARAWLRAHGSGLHRFVV
ncbi:MAG: M48 family metallopeptidase [Sphingobium sp.]